MAEGPLEVLFGEEEGTLLRLAFTTLAVVGPERFEKAVDEIERASSLGPFVDPTAWVDGQRFANAHALRGVLRHCAAVAGELQKVAPEGVRHG